MIETGSNFRGPRAVALEISVDSPDGLHVAAEAGADRVELCAGLEVGGLTPGPGLIEAAIELDLPVHVLVRPRAGDFVASAGDLETMLADIRAVRAAGLAGVVVGAARPDGALDEAALAKCVEAAGLMDVTLHRVIDLVPDPDEALATAIALGMRRVLTSGGAPRAGEGTRTIARLVRQAAGRIEIMAGGGVTPDSAPTLLATGIDALHASCSVAGQADRMGFGRTRRTDAGAITALKRAMMAEKVPA